MAGREEILTEQLGGESIYMYKNKKRSTQAPPRRQLANLTRLGKSGRISREIVGLRYVDSPIGRD